MSIADETFRDSALASHLTHFGEPISYTLRGDPPIPCTGAFSAEQSGGAASEEAGGKSWKRQAEVTISRDPEDADFPGIANPRIGAIIVRANGDKWYVEQVDGTLPSSSTLICTKMGIQSVSLGVE